MRKIFEWPKIIESAAQKLEPHKFHLFIRTINIIHSIGQGNEDTKFRLILNGKTKKRHLNLYLSNSNSNKNGITFLEFHF